MIRLALSLALFAATSATAEAGLNPFVGEIMIFAGNFCPTGYLPADGRLLPINANTALFSILGTMYGGNGTSNFALPNTKPIFTATRATLTECIAVTGVFPSR